MITFLNGKIRINGDEMESNIEREDICHYKMDKYEIRLAYQTNASIDAMETFLFSLVQLSAVKSEDPTINASLEATLDFIRNRM